MSLFDDNDNDVNPFSLKASDRLTINNSFAERYEERKKREEITRLRDKYGDMPPSEDEDEDGSSCSSEDEDGEELTPAVDMQIFRTIAAIRHKDERIYDPKQQFFSDEIIQEKNADVPQIKKRSSEKPYQLKDFHRDTLLSGQIPGDIDETRNTMPPADLTHVQEQEILKQQLKQSIQNAFIDDDAVESIDENFLKVRDKSKDELEREDADYKSWLLNNLKSEDTCREAFSNWLDHQDKQAGDVDDNEAFLMDYVLNRGWVNKDERTLPSYRDIVGDEAVPAESSEDELPAPPTVEPTGPVDLDEDMEALDEADRYEKSYNFRFEELGAMDSESAYQITTHAREVPDSVRRKDSRRALQRDKKKQRKEEEKLQKTEELKRLKNLKKAEIRDRLKKVQALSGVREDVLMDSLASGLDPDKEFDPDEWDKLMGTVFDDSYYEHAEDGVKPVFEEDDVPVETNGKPKDEKITMLKDKLKGVRFDEYTFDADKGGAVDEDDFCMDADYMPGGEHYGEAQPDDKKKSKKEKKKDKKKKDKKIEGSEEAMAVESNDKEGAAADQVNDLLDQLYNLDYEDMIGDLPTRFKYRQVDADSFGLKPEEILTAEDQDLNAYISLKKLAPFRNTESDKHWMEVWKKGKSKRRKALREKLAASTSESASKRNKKRKAENEEMSAAIERDRLAIYAEAQTKKEKKKLK